MSWDFSTTKEVVARKEHSCDWFEHLDASNIINRDNATKKWSVNRAECLDLSMSEEDIAELEAYCEGDFKIKVGEVYKSTSGKWEGDMCSFKAKASISAIVHKYDLAYED
ncbi:hypothetical protein A0256_23195 [Mucilaginibacter sp. PAMC 26640]|nr:hypothetical protein A0256_23195 [Mucilaginibacter sp. PAMC 26640]